MWGLGDAYNLEPKVTQAKSLPSFSDATPILPAIAQDADTNEVLMMAYMNKEAFEETLQTGRAVYFSRSRNRLWRKGEESGHVQTVVGVYIDCDADTILLKVHQKGPACHEGYRSCFFREMKHGSEPVVIAERMKDPDEIYKKS